MTDKIKQVIVARTDLEVPVGKWAAQAAHASIGAYVVAPEKHVNAWFKQGFTKIALGAPDEEALIDVYNIAHKMRLPVFFVNDQGRTCFDNKCTATCVGIGPAPAKMVDKVTGKLNLFDGYIPETRWERFKVWLKGLF